jgi:ribulose-phosphate 3-epimerase
MIPSSLDLHLGLKTDPIQYRYSYEWLFSLLASEGVRHVQFGTFFELYQLPDDFFTSVRRSAERHDILISSVFTAHRELGGFFRDDGPGWAELAERNLSRLIDIAALLGATRAGSNPGAVLRDRLSSKSTGLRRYTDAFKRLMDRAHTRGLDFLTIEPMSCLAEPPTLPDEITSLATELRAHHAASPHSRAKPGYCIDVAHGYADAGKRILHDHFSLMRAALPWTCEIHLKNTDNLYNSTFGFTPADLDRGIIDIPAIRDFYLQNASSLPINQLVGYLEIGGPKLGRDYSDPQLEPQLRQSLQYLKSTWLQDSPPNPQSAIRDGGASPPHPQSTSHPTSSSHPTSNIRHPTSRILLAPSLMCADLLDLRTATRQLESAGVADYYHLDFMDGEFVPNIALPIEILKPLRDITSVPFDVHLMLLHPATVLDRVIASGAHRVALHVESNGDIPELLARLRAAKVVPGVSLRPQTSLQSLRDLKGLFDFVTIMCVNPGFSGQAMVAGAIERIADIRAVVGPHIELVVDGNVSFDNIPNMVAAGADVLVGGTSSLFHKSASLTDNTARIRTLIQQGLQLRRNPA